MENSLMMYFCKALLLEMDHIIMSDKGAKIII